MNTNTLTPPHNVKGGQWRIELRDRVDHLRLCLAAQSGTLDPSLKSDAEKYLKEVDSLINDRQNPAEWWSGSQVELAWTKMRLAEESLVRAETARSDIVASGRVTLGKAQGHLPANDPSVAALAAELEKIGQNRAEAEQAGPARQLSVNVARAYAIVRNTEHQVQRQLRNVLRIVVAVLGLLAVALAAFGIWTDKVPDNLVTAPPGLDKPGLVIAVALGLGALGALFSALPSLAASPSNTTTYNPRAEQAGLKIAVGAWSGLVGLVAATAGLATSGATSDSLAGFVILCMGFGAAQEALTRFADQKADDANPSTS